MPLTPEQNKYLGIIQNLGCPECDAKGRSYHMVLITTSETRNQLEPRVGVGFRLWHVSGPTPITEYVVCAYCGATLLDVTKNEWSDKAKLVVETALSIPIKLATVLFSLVEDFEFGSDAGRYADACVFLQHQYTTLYKEYVEALNSVGLLTVGVLPPLNPQNILFDKMINLGFHNNNSGY